MYFLAAALSLVFSPAPQTDIVRQQDESRQRGASDAKADGVDYDQMLREAFELVDDGDLDAALRAFRRAVTKAPSETLEELEAKTGETRGQALDDLIAEVRMRVAVQGRGNTPLDLTFATSYESRPLGRRLDELCSSLLDVDYHGRSLLLWSRKAEEYVELRADAQKMVGDARLAAAAIGARLRFDPSLKTDRAQRRDLAALRAALGGLVAKISALPGYTSLGAGNDETDPTLSEVRRLVAEEADKAAASQPVDSSD